MKRSVTCRAMRSNNSACETRKILWDARISTLQTNRSDAARYLKTYFGTHHTQARVHAFRQFSGTHKFTTRGRDARVPTILWDAAVRYLIICIRRDLAALQSLRQQVRDWPFLTPSAGNQICPTVRRRESCRKFVSMFERVL